MKFDLCTKHISDEHQIWAIHAGKNKKYYGVFHEESMVFLDYPAINLTLEALKDANKIKRHLKMSFAFRKYFRTKDDTKENPPSRNPNSYSIDSDKDKDLNSHLGNVKNLFVRAKAGDLIIVSGFGQYKSILFGEITKPFDPKDTIMLKGHEYGTVPYRKVKWLRNQPEKRELPQILAKKLENPHAITLIDRDRTNQRFYDFAYDSYVLGESSKIEIYGPDYKGHSPLETHSSNELIAYFIAAYAAIKQGKGNVLHTLSIDDTIAKFYDPNLIENFEQEFHSPGKFRLLARAATLSTFISVCIAWATDTSAQETNLDAIKIVNSKESSDDPITKKTNEDFHYLMKCLGSAKQKELKAKGAKAEKDVGLKSPVAKK